MMHKVSTGSNDMYKQDDTRRGSRRKKTRMEEAKKKIRLGHWAGIEGKQ